MQTVNLFQDFISPNQSGGSREIRMARNVHRLALLGSKGASKLNPAAAILDAVFSVLDAGQAYLRYSAAKAETRALKAQLDVLSHQLDNDLKLLNMDRQKRQTKAQSFTEELRQYLEHNQRQSEVVLGQIQSYRGIFYQLLNLLEQARYQQQGELYEFVQLEATTHHAMRRYLAYVITAQD